MKSQWWRVAGLSAALLMGGAGCAGLERLMVPGAIPGFQKTPSAKRLTETEAPPTAKVHGAESAYRTMHVPVRLNVPDRETCFSVIRSHKMLGTTENAGSFEGGGIVEREFEKVLAADFREPAGGETPVAELSVRIQSGILTQASKTANVEAALRMEVEVAKAGTGEVGYVQRVEGHASSPWADSERVPEAFYGALFDAIHKFSETWDRSDGPDAVVRWNQEGEEGVEPPALKALRWEAVEGKGKMQRGRCTVLCNGFEGFHAKDWANARIKVACRTKLGDIEPERLRVVYDAEEFDAEARTWEFSFRCFGRSERVLDFNAVTGTGTVIGDLELMGMGSEEAAEELKRHVLEAMRSHSGIVTSEHQKTEAFVRFDGVRTDSTHGLVSIDFHLPR